jgi:putative ABC transport system permease protein
MLEWRWIYKARLRFRTLLQRKRVEEELNEELRYHVESRMEQEIARGLAPEDARRIAIRAMEGIEQKKEECRDARGVNLLDSFAQDLRYAIRGVGKSPAFSAVAVLTLAMGISASLTILTVVNSVLLRRAPFAAADRLVMLFANTPTKNQDSTSFPDFLDWKTQSQSFASVAAYRSDALSLTGGGAPEPVVGLRASHELFHVLGVNPTIGRAFDEREQHGKSAVALISFGLWRRRFGGDVGVLGKTVLLNEDVYSVIGVLPQGFQFPSFVDPDVLLPIAESTDRSRGYVLAVGRLKPGTRRDTAQRELDAIAVRLEQAFPFSNRNRGVRSVSLQEAATGNVRIPLMVLMGGAVFVLLIGCANVGGLVLARGIARRRELAVRSALGAGSGRLVRQILTESTVLALLAAVLGCAVALWASKLLVVTLAQRFALPAVTFEWSLLAPALLIAVLSGVLCGLPPALMVRRWHPNAFLQEGSRSLTGGRTEHRLQSLLVISETALTMMLLAGAGLLLKSFVLLQQTDPGLNPRNVLMADLPVSKRYADSERREVFLREITASVEALPGVQEVAVHTDPPFLGGGSRETFTVEGQPDPGPRQGHAAAFNEVGGGFFRAMGIPIKRGRGFDERDTASAVPVAIINQTMARRFWPNADPIGQRIRLYYDKDPQHWLAIAGVAGDAHYYGRDVEPVAQVFVPYQQNPYGSLAYRKAPLASLVVRTAGDPVSLIHALRERIWMVDKDQPIWHVQTMEDALSHSVANRRLYLVLIGSFAGMALMMAAAGIYGLVSYAVVRRTQEMGIRVALGATVGQIVALALRNGMMLTLVGVGAGVAGSLVLTKALSGLLYGIGATDPGTFVGTALLFLGVALVAAYLPARRAAKVDPAVAFRYE